MERVTLNAELRDSTGKSVARSLRREGHLPGVVYRAGDSHPIKLDKKEVVQFINSTLGEQVIVNLKFTNGDTKIALLKDYQRDPVKGELLHADFFEVSMEETISVTVPVLTTGEAVGVKRDAGVLQKTLREIEVECLPGKIPGHLEVDITALEIGQSIHVGDIAVPEGVKVLSSPEEVIVTVTGAQKVEEVEAAVTEEAEEPEVEKKGKKEEAAEPAKEE